MNYRKSRNLMWIGFVVGILIMAFANSFANATLGGAFVLVGSIVFIAALIQAFIFYTCPHCGHSLMDVRGGIPKHCPKCGNELK